MTDMSQEIRQDGTNNKKQNAPATSFTETEITDMPSADGSLTNSNGIHKGCSSHKELNNHKDELVIGTTYEDQPLMTSPPPMSSSNEEGVPYENHSLMSSDEESHLDVIFWDHRPYLKTKSLAEKRGPSDWVMFAGYCKVKGLKFNIKLIPLTGLLEQLLRDRRKKNKYDSLQAQLVWLLDTLGDKEGFYMEHPEQCPLFISFLKKQGESQPHTFKLGWQTFVIAAFDDGNFELTLAMSYGEQMEMLDSVKVKAHKNDDIYKVTERENGIPRQWHSQFVKPETKAADKLRERLAKRKTQ